MVVVSMTLQCRNIGWSWRQVAFGPEPVRE
jgi:hypothetical protein